MAYADYTFYTTEYYGVRIADETEFNRLAERASEYIYGYTQGLSEKILSDYSGSMAAAMVKKATCAIAEVLQDEETAVSKTFSKGQVLASESVGSYSRSFATGGASLSDFELLDKRKREILELYLGSLPEFAHLFQTRSYPCIHRTQ